jgi:protein-tyrosine-phosphatase
MAEALLRRHLAYRGVDAHVSSTGCVVAGRPATPEVIEVLAARGLDARAHTSRVLDPQQVEAADLIVGMAREHVREVTLLEPSAFERTFTLRELVRLGEAVGPVDYSEGSASAALADWLRRVGEDRELIDLVGESSADDVADPIGGPFTVYKKTAAMLDGLIERLAALLAGDTATLAAARNTAGYSTGSGQ